MKKNLLINLPDDVFIKNILLSKVPIKSLLSLKCVCKCLRNLISSRAFIKLHLHANQVVYNNNQLVLLTPIYPDGGNFCFVKVDDSDPCHPEVVNTFFDSIRGRGLDLTIWGSCNGLLCLAEGDDVCLWNPLTKEYKDLPPPLPLEKSAGSITYGFGYDSLMDVYKIIRCRTKYNVGQQGFEVDGDKHVPIVTEFQVYTLETNTWRKISSDNNPYKSHYVVSLKSVVFVNGALHWIISTSEKTEKKILSFDIEKEVFQEIQIPFKLRELPPDPDVLEIQVPEIQVLRECLCMLELDYINKSYYCNVWMMKDYGVEGSWTKLFKIESIYKNPTTSHRLLRFCNNGTKVIMGLYSSLFVYDRTNNKARSIDNGTSGYPEIIYIESLVSLNSGVYKGSPLKLESEPLKSENEPLKLERKRKRKKKQAN